MKDKENDVAFKEGDTENRATINGMRKRILHETAENNVDLSDYKFQKFLNDKGMFKESKEAEKISIHDIKVKNKKIVNEFKFASGSLLEGFLSFYGVQLDKSLDKYERRLHVIEEDDVAFIGKVNKDGELKKVSPNMEKDQAVEKLKEFENQREIKNQKELANELQIQLRRNEGEESK